MKHIRGKDVGEASVVKQPSVDDDRGEHHRERHAGTDGLRQVAAADDDLFPRYDVGGDAAERNGQIVEIDIVLIAVAKLVEKVVHLVVVDVGTGKFAEERPYQALLQDAPEVDGDVDNLCAVPVAERLTQHGSIDAVADDFRPLE